MSLPADIDLALCELIAADADLLSEATSESYLADARKFPRFPFRGRARAIVFPPSGGFEEEPTECEVLTTDLSRGGISLLYRKQLYPGQQVVLVLDKTNRLVEVCWCCRVWAGLYAAGCQFLDAAAHGEADG